MRQYLLMSFYLFVVFSLLVVHRSEILAEHHIDYKLHGFALSNALALAKVMLRAQHLRLGDRFIDAPLIYQTLSRSFLFTVVLACFKIVEDFVVGNCPASPRVYYRSQYPQCSAPTIVLSQPLPAEHCRYGTTDFTTVTPILTAQLQP
ncbi:MAG TPA: hypothetical protein VF772_01985 [Terriglobales bacterium]